MVVAALRHQAIKKASRSIQPEPGGARSCCDAK
jgi:hypothetical protein